jgi:hypothetical protein
VKLRSIWLNLTTNINEGDMNVTTDQINISEARVCKEFRDYDAANKADFDNEW